MAVVIGVVVMAVPGCGDDEPGDRTDAQPLPGAATFQEGGFDELPHFRGAAEVANPVVEKDVTTQSFTTATATPRRVMDFYAEELALDGWTVAEEPGRAGADDTYRGVWRRDEQRLVVSATTFSAAEPPGPNRTTQYSLSLGPA